MNKLTLIKKIQALEDAVRMKGMLREILVECSHYKGITGKFITKVYDKHEDFMINFKTKRNKQSFYCTLWGSHSGYTYDLAYVFKIHAYGKERLSCAGMLAQLNKQPYEYLLEQHKLALKYFDKDRKKLEKLLLKIKEFKTFNFDAELKSCIKTLEKPLDLFLEKLNDTNG